MRPNVRPHRYASPRSEMATGECFTTAFDAAGRPPELLLPGVALITIVVGYLVLVLCVPYWGIGSFLRRRGTVIAAIVLTAIVIVLDVVSTNEGWWNVQFGTAHVVEGDVEEFQPMPDGGRGAERFVVDGVRFQYSDSDPSDGFDLTSIHGGPVRAGLHVRIRFVELDSGPTITKLELSCRRPT